MPRRMAVAAGSDGASIRSSRRPSSRIGIAIRTCQAMASPFETVARRLGTDRRSASMPVSAKARLAFIAFRARATRPSST